MKRENAVREMIRGLLVGSALSLLITLVGIAVCAAMISAEMIGPSMGDYGVILILLTGSFAGAKGAIGKVGAKRLLTGVCAGFAYFLVLLAMTALFFGGQYGRVGETALVILSGAVAAAITGIKSKKPVTSRKSKIRHR